MPPRRRGRTSKHEKRANVFLNVPYDNRFENLYLAYIAGLTAFGLVPRATLELRPSERRLDRIIKLMRSCRYAIHDLSRVELDRSPPLTPRFNMPFELGLSVAIERFGTKDHSWHVFESRYHRLAKSLSDLNGTDVYIHGGRIDGIFRELCNAFVHLDLQPTVQSMARVYRDLRKGLPSILRAAGAKSAFEARPFKEICILAKLSSRKNRRGST
jgi:hypothetical protein